MEEIQRHPSDLEIKGSFLDVLVILAENARLLVMGPLLVGLFALGICFVIPQTYKSVAVLQADPTAASLMQTAAVLDPVILSLGLAKDITIEEARIKLQERIKVVAGRTDKLLTLTLYDYSPKQAQAIALAVIQRTFQESRPKGTVRLRLEAQLMEVTGRLKNAQAMGENLRQRLTLSGAPGNANPTGSSELARGYAELLSATGAAQNQVVLLESQLEGLSDAQVVQFPTMPEKPSSPRKALIAVGATLAAGLALLVFVFIRQAIGSSLAQATVLAKLQRIRSALRMR